MGTYGKTRQDEAFFLLLLSPFLAQQQKAESWIVFMDGPIFGLPFFLSLTSGK